MARNTPNSFDAALDRVMAAPMVLFAIPLAPFMLAAAVLMLVRRLGGGSDG